MPDQPYRTHLLTGTAKNNARQLADKLQGPQTAVISSKDLVRDYYQRTQQSPPDFTSILNWDRQTQHLISTAAYANLDNYIQRNHNRDLTDVIVVGHMTFPHEYDRANIVPAIHRSTLEDHVRPDTLVNVMYNPWQSARSSTKTQWEPLGAEGFRAWSNTEYEMSRMLCPQNTNFYVIGGVSTDENATALAELLNNQKPIGYFSYGITGVKQATIDAMSGLKDRLRTHLNIVPHEGLDIEQDINQPSIRQILKKFQLDGLMPQAQINIAYYPDDAEKISAGTQAEGAMAKVLSKRTVIRHPMPEKLSPYKIDNYLDVVRTDEELESYISQWAH